MYYVLRVKYILIYFVFEFYILEKIEYSYIFQQQFLFFKYISTHTYQVIFDKWKLFTYVSKQFFKQTIYYREFPKFSLIVALTFK